MRKTCEQDQPLRSMGDGTTSSGELTLYMDLWNDELIAHALSSTRGDRMIYLNGLRDVIEFKK